MTTEELIEDMEANWGAGICVSIVAKLHAANHLCRSVERFAAEARRQGWDGVAIELAHAIENYRNAGEDEG